jgi:AraC-like DNA-binding protein
MHIELENDHDLAGTLAEYITRTSAFNHADCCYIFATPSAKGCIKEVYLAPDFVLTLVDVATSGRFCFRARMAVSDMVEAGFSLKGNVEFSIKGSRQDFDTYPGQGYLSVAGGEMDTVLSVPPGQHVRVVEIRFSAESFDTYSAFADWVLPAPLKKPAIGGRREQSQKCACLLSPEMRTGVEALVARGFAGSGDFMEIEELCIDCTGGLVSFFRNGMGNTRTVLSSADLERVREARDILGRRMENPPGIRELALMVNLNDYKLKTGFRQAFGSTVHRTLRDMRLEKAYNLLSFGGFSVTEAALYVGYRNIGDFGIAFKRRYGISPGKIRFGS